MTREKTSDHDNMNEDTPAKQTRKAHRNQGESGGGAKAQNTQSQGGKRAQSTKKK